MTVVRSLALVTSTFVACVIPPAQGNQPGAYAYGGDGYGGYADPEQMTPATASREPATPSFVTVNVHSALVGIKSNKKPWDGPGALPVENMRALEKTLISSGNVYAVAAAAALEMGNIANSGFDSPDTFGELQVFSRAGVQRLTIPYTPDSYTPYWNALTVANVPLGDSTVRLQVSLTDRDAINNDPIAHAQLNSDDIAAALADGRIYPVPVHTQTGQQLLFVYISVMPQM